MKAEGFIQEIWLAESLLSGTQEEVSLLLQLQKEFPGLKVVSKPKGTRPGKSAALNYGLKFARGEVIGVFDADTRVARDFLKKSIPLLSPSIIGGVQGKVRIYNPQSSLLTSLQNDEFTVMVNFSQLSKEIFGGVPTLAGNGQLVKREVLAKVEGWNELSITEDMDLSIKMLLKGYRIRYCPQAVLWQEGIQTPARLLRQRIRWAEGLLKCLFDYCWAILCCPATIIQKADISLSLFRVTMSLWVIIGYVYSLFAALFWGKFYSVLPAIVLVIASWVLFFGMVLAMHKEATANLFKLSWKVLRYWAYNFFWVMAVPVGFINVIRRMGSIVWDKTSHQGDVPRAEVHVPGSLLPVEIIE